MLSNQRFYHQISRKATIAFGSLFTNIFIQRTDKDNNVIQSINVPLEYSAKQKFMAAVLYKQDSEDRQFQQVLPRMGFEIVAYDRNPTRKMTSNINPTKYTGGAASVNSISAPQLTASQLASGAPPVPYTLTFVLHIAAKNQDDMLQIFEQIVPYFNPTYSVPVIWIPELNIASDFPITLLSVKPSDSYDGLLTERREIIWELTFTANVDYYGALTSSEVIKSVIVNLFDTTSPLATDSPTTAYTLSVNPTTASATDNYTFMESWSE